MRMLLLISMLALSGCATQSNTIETLFVFGTMKAIEKADDPAVKAEKIRSIAQQINDIASAESVRAEVIQLLIEEVTKSSDLSPADMYLIGQVAPLSGEFANDQGVIDGERLDLLRGFLADIIAATNLYQ